jgi:hypothetical protein
MKKVTLIVRQTELNRLLPNGLQLTLEDDASILEAVAAFDWEVKNKCGKCPVKGFDSVLEMIYHPSECRFYKQVAIQAYTASNQFINMRENIKTPLPDGTTIILVPQGGCITDYEEPIRQKQL